MSADLLHTDESALGDLPFEVLRAALAAEDVEERAAGLYALGRRPEPEAIDLLAAALGDASSFLARTAAQSLEQQGPAATLALIAALRNPDAQTRGLAARALAHLGDPSAIPALFKALDDDSSVVQYWADEGLDRLGVGQVYFKP
jgi:HEAT repeat protein